MTQTLRFAVAGALALIGPTLRAMVRAPRDWRGAAWLGVLGFALLVAVAYVEKTRLQAAIPLTTTAEPLAWAANTLGGGVAVTVLGVGLLVLGAALGRRAWLDTAVVLAAAAAPCFLLTKLGQYVLAEDRPSEGGAMHYFVAFGHGVSGHASASALLFFPIVTVLGRDLSLARRRALAISLALWIALVAWMRMALSMHFAWNVLLGIALGLYVGHAATSAWSARRA